MRISDWSSDVCSSDLDLSDLGADEVVEFGVEGLDESRAAALILPARAEEIARLEREGRQIAGSAPGRCRPGFAGTGRSDERRGGKECVSKCRSRWSPSQ